MSYEFLEFQAGMSNKNANFIPHSSLKLQKLITHNS